MAVLLRSSLYKLFQPLEKSDRKHKPRYIIGFDNAGRFYQFGRIIEWHCYHTLRQARFQSVKDATAYMDRLFAEGIQEFGWKEIP